MGRGPSHNTPREARQDVGVAAAHAEREVQFSTASGNELHLRRASMELCFPSRKDITMCRKRWLDASRTWIAGLAIFLLALDVQAQAQQGPDVQSGFQGEQQGEHRDPNQVGSMSVGRGASGDRG